MSKATSEHRKYIINTVMRWLLFGVFVTAIPPLFNSWYKIIVGRSIDYYDILPDILIAVLSVCCNSINTCVDGDKKVAHCLRWILGIIFGLISLGCWGLYFIIFFSKEILSKLKIEVEGIESIHLIDNNMSCFLFYISTVIIICCAIIGGIIEFRTAKSNTSFQS